MAERRGERRPARQHNRPIPVRPEGAAVNTVGIIGVGAMGMAMARNLHARGYRVCTRDVRVAADD